jgi:hypothetical protein
VSPELHRARRSAVTPRRPASIKRPATASQPQVGPDNGIGTVRAFQNDPYQLVRHQRRDGLGLPREFAHIRNAGVHAGRQSDAFRHCYRDPGKRTVFKDRADCGEGFRLGIYGDVTAMQRHIGMQSGCEAGLVESVCITAPLTPKCGARHCAIVRARRSLAPDAWDFGRGMAARHPWPNICRGSSGWPLEAVMSPPTVVSSSGRS